MGVMKLNITGHGSFRYLTVLMFLGTLSLIIDYHSTSIYFDFKRIVVNRSDNPKNQSVTMISTHPTRNFKPQFHPTLILDGTRHHVKEYFNSNEFNDEFPLIKAYIEWHKTMRQQFSDFQLLNDPNAPPLFILYWDQDEGGLYDRMHRLHEIFSYCIDNGRLIFLKWYHPMPLETFLRPHLLNWTVPNHQKLNEIENLETLYEQYNETLYEQYNETLEISSRILIKKGTRHFNFDTIINFGVTWHTFFLPSRTIQGQLDEVYSSIGLKTGDYNSIHCRIKHPANYRKSYIPNRTVDEGVNVKVEGKLMDKAINCAYNAFRCSDMIIESTKLDLSDEKRIKTYFYSDTTDLVQKVKDGALEPFSDEFSRIDVVSRDIKESIVHIDTASNATVEALASTFVDLYIASNSKCIFTGLGRFAILSAEIGGNVDCVVQHQSVGSRKTKKWGMRGKKDAITRSCPKQKKKLILESGRVVELVKY